MASDEENKGLKELEIKIRELDIREEEIKIRREELSAKKLTKYRWLFSPATLPVLAALSGFLATAYSLHKQALANLDLEERKMEYSLIQNALADPNKKQAIRNLKFLDEVGLIKQFSVAQIIDISKNAEKAPSFAGAVIRDEIISVADAKRLLKKQGAYEGLIDDIDDGNFRHAIAKFQMMQGKNPDGLLGPCTLRELWMISAEVTPIVREGKSVALNSPSAADCR